MVRGEHLVAVMMGLLAGGCAWRIANTEHYIGPTFFRFTDAGAGGVDVGEVLHVGVLIEAGSQWGLSVGVADRIAAVPGDGNSELGPSAGTPLWTASLGLPAHATPGHWSFSPFYLRATHRAPPRFTRRTTLGVQMGVGDEVNALSVGFTSRTSVLPSANAFCALDFDASHPMAMRFTVWEANGAGQFPLETIVKEVDK